MPVYDVHKIIDCFRHPHPGLFIFSAHRALRWHGVPDNSSRAIYQAATAGIECVELDVQLSLDAHPVIFHDDHLGRCTNIAEYNNRSDVYNPMTGRGYNPAVGALTWQELSRLRLKDETGTISVEHLMDTLDMVAFIAENDLQVVVLLDIKTKAAVPLCAEMLLGRTNSKGIPAMEWCVWKLDSSWYPTPENFEEAEWVRNAVQAGTPPLLIPVVRPETARNLTSPIATVKAFSRTPYTIGFEVGLRSPGGYLQDIVDYIKSGESPVRSLGFFGSLGDQHPDMNTPDPWNEIALQLQNGIHPRLWCYGENMSPVYYASVSIEDAPDGLDRRCELDKYIALGYNWIIADYGPSILRWLAKRNPRHQSVPYIGEKLCIYV